MPQAGLEPARPITGISGFSYHFDFRRRSLVRGLDCAFIMVDRFRSTLDALHPVSTPSQDFHLELGSALPVKGSPTLKGSTPAVSSRALTAKTFTCPFASPVRLPISPLRHILLLKQKDRSTKIWVRLPISSQPPNIIQLQNRHPLLSPVRLPISPPGHSKD